MGLQQQPKLVRVMAEQEVLRIAASLPIRSSCPFNWPGIEVHRYCIQSHEPPEHSYPHLTVFVSHVDQPDRVEVLAGGNRMTGVIENGSVSIAPPGLPIRLLKRPKSSHHESTVIFIDPFVVAKIASAEGALGSVEVLPQYHIRDPLIREIGEALDRELVSGNPSPLIYIESLAVALTAHILSRYGNLASVQKRGDAVHRIAQLRRSLDYMQENLQNKLTLAEVAAVSNMSKYHFAKAFRHAMGIAPHRYLMALRMSKARELLAVGDLPIQEIAFRVGYTDRSHFTTEFLKVTGVTPARYRQELASSKRA
jgi:AraC family transcriptional regulator